MPFDPSPCKMIWLFPCGKVVEETGYRQGFLCMTVFCVQEDHDVYFPEETIYSNDFLQGIWRVISPKATQGHIDHVSVCTTNSESNNKEKYHSDKHIIIEKEVLALAYISFSGKDYCIFDLMLCCYDIFLPNFGFGKMKDGEQSFLPNSDFENIEIGRRQ